MVTITLHCIHCQSEALVRNGHAPNGKQLYRCRTCGRQSRENPTPHAYPEARREEILHAYQERSSLRGLTRTFGVSRCTGYLEYPFGKSQCKSDRACLHWLQYDMQPR
jgi:transposase-like protein